MPELKIRVTEDELTDIKKRAADLRTTVQSAGYEMFMQWATGNPASSTPKKVSLELNEKSTITVQSAIQSESSEIERWVTLFRDLLKSGNPVVCDAITRNVHAFAQLIEAIDAGYSVSSIPETFKRNAALAAALAASIDADTATARGERPGTKNSTTARRNSGTG